jgi:hypothetical protein
LEEIPGIDPASVEFIQAAVVAYYSQFEEPATEGSAAVEEAGEAQAESGAEIAVEDVEQAGSESVEEPPEPVSEEAEAVSGEDAEKTKQFGTIEDAGSPHNHAEGAGAESVPENSSGE